MKDKNLDPVKFGILGTGWIADSFARALSASDIIDLCAVGSRSEESARDFALRHGIPSAYDSYEKLLADPSVDIVYIATPSPRHQEDALACLNAGKAVLCEKPFTTNASEARSVVECARSKQLFCMEAMWMRFHPLIQAARTAVKEGSIGENLVLNTEFGHRWKNEGYNRMLDPNAGGGAILDLGVYGISLAFYLFGAPDDITSCCTMSSAGVDETTVAVLRHGRALSTMTASVVAELDNRAVIIGSKNRITLGSHFINPSWSLCEPVRELGPFEIPKSSNALARNRLNALRQNLQKVRAKLGALSRGISGKPSKGELTKVPPETNAFRLEAEEAARCFRAGETESKIMPLDETIKVMEILDRIREN